MVKNGVDINAANDDGDLPLHIAALNSNVKVADLLIKAGAPVNSVGDGGRTPLFWAVINGTFNTN